MKQIDKRDKKSMFLSKCKECGARAVVLIAVWLMVLIMGCSTTRNRQADFEQNRNKRLVVEQIPANTVYPPKYYVVNEYIKGENDGKYMVSK